MKNNSFLLKIIAISLILLIAIVTKNGNVFDSYKTDNKNSDKCIVSINDKNSDNISDKNALVALLVALLVPISGIQSFYAGRWGRGIAQLLTFNFLLVDWIYDIIMICMEKFKDSEGKVMKFKI